MSVPNSLKPQSSIPRLFQRPSLKTHFFQPTISFSRGCSAYGFRSRRRASWDYVRNMIKSSHYLPKPPLQFRKEARKWHHRQWPHCDVWQELYDGLTGSNMLATLKDLVPAATNTVNTKFIVLDKGSLTQEGTEIICLALVADETASVHFQMWGSECEAFVPGDIVQLTNGIFSYHKNNLVLRAGKRGRAEKVGEFTMLFVETPNMSEIRWSRDSKDPKKFVQEEAVSHHSRIFPPLP